INRHGMPKLPVGQHEVEKWPVLDLGVHPEIPLEQWRLVVDGDGDHPYHLDWAGLLSLEQVEDVSDFHCVTTWSKMDMVWRGVRLSTIAALAAPRDSATWLMAYGWDGYSTNIPLVEAVKDDVLLVHTANGEPLDKEHGGPVR